MVGKGDEGESDDNENERKDEFFRIRNSFAEVVSEERYAACPDKSADHIVEKKDRVAHASDAREYRRKGAHDRNEPRDKDRARAIALEEDTRLLKVFFLEKT